MSPSNRIQIRINYRRVYNYTSIQNNMYLYIIHVVHRPDAMHTYRVINKQIYDIVTYLYIMIHVNESFRFYLPNFAINIVFTSRVRHTYLYWGIKYIGAAIIRFHRLYIYYYIHLLFSFIYFSFGVQGKWKGSCGIIDRTKSWCGTSEPIIIRSSTRYKSDIMTKWASLPER